MDCTAGPRCAGGPEALDGPSSRRARPRGSRLRGGVGVSAGFDDDELRRAPRGSRRRGGVGAATGSRGSVRSLSASRSRSSSTAGEYSDASDARPRRGLGGDHATSDETTRTVTSSPFSSSTPEGASGGRRGDVDAGAGAATAGGAAALPSALAARGGGGAEGAGDGRSGGDAAALPSALAGGDTSS